MSALKKKITEREIELATLKTHLILREPNLEEQFNEAQSVEDLMKVILKDCSFTNPDLLESFALEFDLPGLEEKVERYRDDLHVYYDQVLAEDFAKEGADQYDKNANIEVGMFRVNVNS